MEHWGRRVSRLAVRLEAPTWLLIGTIYGGWLALTFWWTALPAWVVIPCGAWLCAWHMSLQHELIHGHPTRYPALNAALAAPPLNLWLPFPLYREQHLRHHRAADLTDPLRDPESTYMTPRAWAQSGPLRRSLHGACNTLAGRILAGPAVSAALFWIHQIRRDSWRPQNRTLWLGHAAWVGVILYWVCHICHVPFLAYLTCFIYPGTALSMIRSLAEHRAADRPEDRTAVVERAGLLGLLFLNNNLHILHHERPLLAWYSLPGEWRRMRATLLGVRGGPVYRGYRDIARLYAWRPHHPGPHPLGATFHVDIPQDAPGSATFPAVAGGSTPG